MTLNGNNGVEVWRYTSPEILLLKDYSENVDVWFENFLYHIYIKSKFKFISANLIINKYCEFIKGHWVVLLSS